MAGSYGRELAMYPHVVVVLLSYEVTVLVEEFASVTVLVEEFASGREVFVLPFAV
jgi:hypothetical protein